MAVLLWVIVATGWGIRGSLFFHVMPQPVDSLTREVAWAPGTQIEWQTPLQGVTVTARWRGLYHDSSRPWASTSQWTSAYLRYRTSRLSLTLGRQFAFVGIGGLLDGAFLRMYFKQVSLQALFGYRVPSALNQGTRWFDRNGERLGAVYLRFRPWTAWTLGVGYAQAADTAQVYQAPLWVDVQKMGNLSGLLDLAYDVDQRALSRVNISLGYRNPYGYLGLRYQMQGMSEIFRRLGWEGHADEEEGEEEEIPTAAFHRITGIMSVQTLVPVSLSLWARIGEESSAHGAQIRVVYRGITLRAWIIGKSGERQQGIEAAIWYPVRPDLRLSLAGAVATQPEWPDSWIEHFRAGIRWSLPFGGVAHGEYRFLVNPFVEAESRGYFFLEVPFEWRGQP